MLGVEGSACLRRLADREQRVACQDDVDLLVVNGVLLVEHDGRQEHAEDVIAVTLHRRPRLVLVFRLREQELEGALLELARGVRTELVCRRVEKIDPVRGHRREIRGSVR